MSTLLIFTTLCILLAKLKEQKDKGESGITGYDVKRPVEDGHQYEHKVKAYNAAGGGTHSDPSLLITARPMKSPPKLNLDVLNQRIRLKAGEEIHVLIPFIPLPNVTCEKEGKSAQSKRFASEIKPELILFYQRIRLKA